MKNIIIKHCNRPDYLDRLWNPSSLEILEMLERHYYLYLHNQTMEETEKSLPALCFCELMLQRKKKRKKHQKPPHHQKPQTSKKQPTKKKTTKKPQNKTP